MGEKDGKAAPADSAVPSEAPPQYTPMAEGVAAALAVEASTSAAASSTTTTTTTTSLPVRSATRSPAAGGSGSGAGAGAASPSPRGGQPPRKPLPLLHLPILDHLRANRVILASASPRRRALLAQIGLTKLEIWPSELPEDLPKSEYGAYEYVVATARRKCLDVYQEVLASQEEEAGVDGEADKGSPGGDAPPDPVLVIAADTVVVSRAGQILEKPRSAAEHGRMLRHLRDTRVHRVVTSVCALSPREDAAYPGYQMATHTEETTVIFASQADGLSDAAIDAYVRTREGADKAGGYALQGMGGLILVERVEGCVDNVIGLPVRRLLQLAEQVIFNQGDEEDAYATDEEEE